MRSPGKPCVRRGSLPAQLTAVRYTTTRYDAWGKATSSGLAEDALMFAALNRKFDNVPGRQQRDNTMNKF